MAGHCPSLLRSVVTQNFLNKNTAQAVFLENSWLCSVCGSRTDYYMDLIAIGHEIQLFKDKLGLPNLH